MREFVIAKNDANQRLDKFLTKAVPKLPQGLVYKSLRTKRIKRNGKRCTGAERLCEGDVLSLYLNDEFFEESEPAYAFLTAPAEVSVVYEDEHILLADKPAGLVVHEDEANTADTLIARIQHYLYQKGEYEPAAEQSFAPALCNRLDRNTGGIVICAKTAEALRILNEKIRARELEKRYLCVTYGIPAQPAATLSAFHKKDEKTKTAIVRDKAFPGARTMITKYRVRKQNAPLALLEVELITGRTHQIRAHFAHIGCPLLGDGKYGFNRVNTAYHVKYQLLYSYYLRFDFKTDAGALSYLNKKIFTTPEPWFCEKFFPQ